MNSTSLRDLAGVLWDRGHQNRKPAATATSNAASSTGPDISDIDVPPPGWRLVLVKDGAPGDEPDWDQVCRRVEQSTGIRLGGALLSAFILEVRRWQAQHVAWDAARLTPDSPLSRLPQTPAEVQLLQHALAVARRMGVQSEPGDASGHTRPVPAASERGVGHAFDVTLDSEESQVLSALLKPASFFGMPRRLRLVLGAGPCGWGLYAADGDDRDLHEMHLLELLSPGATASRHEVAYV